MVKTRTTVGGYVPKKAYVKNGILFCNVATGCAVYVGHREIVRVDGPVFNHRINYQLKDNEVFECRY